MPGVGRAPDGAGARGHHGRRRLDRRQRRDRRVVRAPRRAVPARHAAERRPEPRAQHGNRCRRRALPRVPGQRRRAAAELVRAAAGRAREDGVRLRDRQRAPADAVRHRAVAVPGARVRRDPAAHARDEVPAPDRRPDRLEQALAALVLGPPRLPLPRGTAQRGHPGHRAGALPRLVGRRDRRPRLLLAHPRGRRPVDHPAAARTACAARPPAGDPGRQRPPRAAGAAAGQALVRRERRRRRPALLRERPRGRRRRLRRAVHGPRQRVPGRGGQARSTTRCRRSSGSNGTSSGDGWCRN